MKNHPALTEENLAAIRQLQQAIVNMVTIYENHKMLQPITTSTAQGLTALFEGCDNDLENHFQSTQILLAFLTSSVEKEMAEQKIDQII